MSLKKKLPKFEGVEVEGATLKINGIGDDLMEPLVVGHKVYYVIEAEISDVGHGNVRKGKTSRFVRKHTAVVLRTGQMDTKEAQHVLAAEAERRAQERDDAEGKVVLPFGRGDDDGDDGTDGKTRAAGG